MKRLTPIGIALSLLLGLALWSGGRVKAKGVPAIPVSAFPLPACSASKIFNIAGFGSTGFPTATTRIYDIATNTWSTGAPLPTALTDHATAYWNGIIYIAAGYDGTAPVNTLRAYNIATNSWSTLAPLPQPLFLPGFGIINGKLYIASGNSGFTPLNTLYIYDIASDSWSTGANVPTPMTGPGSAVLNGKLYLFGGGFPTPTNLTQVYDPGTNSWSGGPNMNVSRVWFYGAAIGTSSIVAPGGDNPPGLSINANEQLTASWAVRAPLPFNSRGPFAVSDGTFVYIGGGFDGSTARNDLLRYDPVANTYTTLAPSPDAHFLSQAVLVPSLCSPPTISKAFGAATIPLNGSTSLSFTINNPNTATLNGIGFSDTLPAGLNVSTPNGLTGSCGGGVITATAGSNSISLAGASLAANTPCTFSVNVTGIGAGLQTNTTGNVTSTEGGNGGTATASVTVCSTPTIVCPGSITKFTDSGQVTATVDPGAPVSSSGCGIAVTGVRSDGKPLNAPFPIGVTTIIWTAKDANGTTSSCGQSITVMFPSGQRRIP